MFEACFLYTCVCIKHVEHVQCMQAVFRMMCSVTVALEKTRRGSFCRSPPTLRTRTMDTYRQIDCTLSLVQTFVDHTPEKRFSTLPWEKKNHTSPFMVRQSKIYSSKTRSPVLNHQLYLRMIRRKLVEVKHGGGHVPQLVPQKADFVTLNRTKFVRLFALWSESYECLSRRLANARNNCSSTSTIKSTNFFLRSSCAFEQGAFRAAWPWKVIFVQIV